MKVIPIHGHENWLCDRYAEEWMNFNVSHSAKHYNVNDAEILWLLAPWEWRNVPEGYLKNKKVVCTIHHMVPNKTNDQTWAEFKERDKYIDAYHTPCLASWEQFSKHVNGKPHLVQPFWSNSSIFSPVKKEVVPNLRFKYGLGLDSYIIGSFQRDTEGSDLKSPKLEKGPDILCDILEEIKKDKPNLEILLAGWRRQYVINRLEQANINYKYIELPSIEVINELYNCLDQYIVAARYEGGPQAISECIMTKTPIVSTKVGLAEKFLHPKSIFSNKEDFKKASCDDECLSYSSKLLEPHLMPEGFTKFNSFFDSL